MNTSRGATPTLRKAISSLIDRDQIVALAYEGATVVADTVWPAYSGLQPYMDAISEIIADGAVTYDPAAGRGVLHRGRLRQGWRRLLEQGWRASVADLADQFGLAPRT